MKTQNDNNVFSKVFEANITFRIAQNTKQENVDEILVALDFVAHHIHFNKKYPLPVEEFEATINEYNERYDNDLNPKMVYDIAIKSNIIKEVPNEFGIEFCDENLLAYFTALHLNRGLNEGKCVEELKYILDNICFEINGDIILFLSYITSNVKILYPIMESMIGLMDEWDEFSFEKSNIEFLSRRTVPYIKRSINEMDDKWNIFNVVTENRLYIIPKIEGEADRKIAAILTVEPIDNFNRKLNLYWELDYDFKKSGFLMLELFNSLKEKSIWKADYVIEWMDNELINAVNEFYERNILKNKNEKKFFHLMEMIGAKLKNILNRYYP